MLKGFMAWMVKIKVVPINYLEDVQPKQTKKVKAGTIWFFILLKGSLSMTKCFNEGYLN
jgi:hypothetical protein